MNIELYAVTIALAMKSTLKINLQTSCYLSGCREYRTGYEIKIKNIAECTVFHIEMDVVANIALSLRSIFKIKLLSISLYRAGCCKYRTWSEINIQNIAFTHFEYPAAGCREYRVGSDNIVTDPISISRWMPRISRWL